MECFTWSPDNVKLQSGKAMHKTRMTHCVCVWLVSSHPHLKVSGLFAFRKHANTDTCTHTPKWLFRSGAPSQTEAMCKQSILMLIIEQLDTQTYDRYANRDMQIQAAAASPWRMLRLVVPLLCVTTGWWFKINKLFSCLFIISFSQCDNLSLI